MRQDRQVRLTTMVEIAKPGSPDLHEAVVFRRALDWDSTTAEAHAKHPARLDVWESRMLETILCVCSVCALIARQVKLPGTGLRKQEP